jgi:hypothetical protein
MSALFALLIAQGFFLSLSPSIRMKEKRDSKGPKSASVAEKVFNDTYLPKTI